MGDKHGGVGGSSETLDGEDQVSFSRANGHSAFENYADNGKETKGKTASTSNQAVQVDLDEQFVANKLKARERSAWDTFKDQTTALMKHNISLYVG